MNDEPNESTAFERRAREVLGQSVERLDAATRSKLTQARYAALAEVSVTKPRYGRWLVPAGSLATVAAVAVLVMVSRTPGREASAAASLEDLEIVAPEGDVDMLQDVEFYAWIDADEPSAKDSGA